MPNSNLWACMVAAATALFYTLSFANGKCILKGNGEQVSFDDVVECSQYLHKKKVQGDGKHYRERKHRISSFMHSHRFDIYAGEAREFGL